MIPHLAFSLISFKSSIIRMCTAEKMKFSIKDFFSKCDQKFQKQPLEVFCKKRSSSNFTGKHLCWSLILIKFQAFRPALGTPFVRTSENDYFWNFPFLTHKIVELPLIFVFFFKSGLFLTHYTVPLCLQMIVYQICANLKN